jgi:translation initiation factor IF-2
MRVYEFAREYNITSKDVMTVLKKGNIDVASHMTILSQDALNHLEKSFMKKSGSDEPKKSFVEKRDTPLEQKDMRKTIGENVKPALTKTETPVQQKQSEHRFIDRRNDPRITTVEPKRKPEIKPDNFLKKPQTEEKPLTPMPTLNTQVAHKKTVTTVPVASPLHQKLPRTDGTPVPKDSSFKRPLAGNKAKQSKVHRVTNMPLEEEEDLTVKVAGMPSLVRTGRTRRRGKGRSRRDQAAHVPEVITEITVTEQLPLFQVADMMGRSSSEVIMVLLKQGNVYNRNQLLPLQTIVTLGKAFDVAVHIPTEKLSQVKKTTLDKQIDGVQRSPIVVVMGHVDHGKTTLLDFVRKMNTAAREKGGITQHLAAYEVDSKQGKITFLDTPGHKAFSYMRERGAKVTDIAILVIAADDGIKPQTIEALNHAKKAEVPIIVAITKIDKVANKSTALDTIKRQLTEHGMVAEDWGGDTVCVPLSAKTGEGVEELLEMVSLQAELLELRADVDGEARAFVLESKLERGYGPVATVISLKGKLRVGDHFVCGSSSGKIRLLINSYGQKVTEALPSIPVQVVGFSDFVSLGDWLQVVPVKEYAKARSSRSVSLLSPVVASTAQLMLKEQKTDNLIKILIKTDTQGSLQAIVTSIDEVVRKHKNIPAQFQIVSSGVGDLSEGDISLAHDMKALIVTLHIRTERNAISLAKEKDVEIHSYQIIYQLIDYLESLLLRYRVVKKYFEKVGEAVVRKVFDVKDLGVIAGCYIQDGVFSRTCKVTCIRAGKVVGEGVIASLQRDKKTVKEVHKGFECGFICNGFSGWQEGDTVHAFIEKEEKL